MDKIQLADWLALHGYERNDRLIGPDSEPGWEAYANRTRGRGVFVCDTEVMFVSGLGVSRARISNVHLSPSCDGFLGMQGQHHVWVHTVERMFDPPVAADEGDAPAVEATP